MPVMKLTRGALQQLQPASKVAFYRDQASPGLALKITPLDTRVWVFEYRMPGSGRAGAVRRLTIGRHPPLTLDMARERARELYGEVRAGRDPAAARRLAAGQPTFREFADLWMAHYPADLELKPQTIKDYRWLLDNRLLPQIGARRVADITAADVLDLRARLGRNRTCGKAIALLHRMLEVAEWPQTPWNALRPPNSNPAHRVEVIKGRTAQRRFTDDELRRIWGAIRRLELSEEITRWAAGCLRCLMLSGARFRELAGHSDHPGMGARWECLNVERLELRIDDHKSSRRRGAKVLHLAPRVVEEMQALPVVGPYIFANSRQRSQPIGSGAQHAWSLVRQAAGITGRDAGLHCFRHTVLNLADEAGLARSHAGAAVGHTALSTTERYIADAKKRQAQEAVRVFAAEVGRRVDQPAG